MRIIIVGDDDVKLLLLAVEILEHKKREEKDVVEILERATPEQLAGLRRSLAAFTPSSLWHSRGETDPHDTRYDCERADLIGGNLTDDQVANLVFMSPDIGTTTIAKDRIRWLSRRLEETMKKLRESLSAG